MTTPRMNNGEITRAVKLALMASAVPLITTGSLAYAQEADEEGAVVEEIIVTGSRIPQRNLISSSPVTTVNAAEIQFQGVTRIEDLLNNLPQVSPDQQSGVSNGSTGTATVDLRGLEPERTLVLLNGRRLPSGSPGAGGISADLNQIPAALVERVDVLTGGASAAYGSDAVAGVVNFITKTDFEGFSLDYQYSWYTHKNDNSAINQLSIDNGFAVPEEDVSDGFTTDVSMVMGINSGDGRGNVTAYATYREIDEILQGNRDYSNCALGGPPSAFSCGGSSTLPDGRFTAFGTVDPNFDFITQGDQFAPRDGLLYNYAPANHFQRPDERIIAGAIGNYVFNDRLEIFAELSYMDDKSVAQIAPSGAFFVTSSLPCGNPLLSAQQFQVICGDYGLTTADTQSVFIGRRNVEGGNRQDTLRHTSQRIVLGARGELSDNWTYEAYTNFSEVSFSQTYLNDLSTTRIIRALNAVDDGSGNIVCQSVIDGSDPNCIPWNVFQTGAVGGPGSPIQNYLSVPLFATGETSSSIFNGYVTGDLTDYGLQLPNTDSGIQVVGGYEFRQEKLRFSPDVGFATGDGAGQGGPVTAVEGDFDVNDFFFEAYIPLLEGLDAAQSVNLNLGYRFSDYSTNQETDTYKAAFDWSINDSVRLRASYQRAVRAGNIRELFRPQRIGLFDLDVDPCATATPEATLEQCMRTGVTAAQYGNIADSPAGQYNQISGGNPDLTPEESDTVSFGGIFTPAFLDGLVVSLDYYQIEIDDAISDISPAFILDECLQTGNPIFCDAVNRGPVTGTLWLLQDNIVSTDINIGSFTREGVDLQVGYGFDIGEYGGLDFQLVGTYVLAAEEVPTPGAPTIVCEGFWDNNNCGPTTPEWAHTFRTTWATPWDADVSLLWRYIGEADELGVNQANFSAESYFDISANWSVTENVLLRFGLNNLFDEEPPLSADVGAGDGNGNTFPGVYDARGRYWFAGISLNL